METEARLELAAMVQSLRSDLRSVDITFRDFKELWEWMGAFKLAAVALGNVVDLEPQTKNLYRKHPDLSTAFAAVEREALFARYLRNTFVAHQNGALVRQAIVWRPDIKTIINKSDEYSAVLVDLFVLETAINTYISEGGAHKIFDSETDLVYPPDFERFKDYLKRTISDARTYLDKLLEILIEGYTAPGSGEEFELAVQASRMDFGFVTKGRR